MDETREALARIDERTAHTAIDIKELKEEIRSGFKDHEERIRSLEDSRNKASGFWQGANWVRGIITAIPAGLLGLLLGKHST